MKFIVKTLVALLLVALSSSSSLRTSKFSEGSFKDGLGVDIGFLDSTWGAQWTKDPTNCKFLAKEVSDGGKGDNEHGLAFDFGSGAPSAETKKYLTLLSGNKWFLPYRNMNNESPRTVYISESFMNRRIEVLFKTDSGVEKILKIIFPYKKMGDYITKTELVSTFNQMKALAGKFYLGVKTEKSSILTAVQGLIDNAVFLNSAKKGSAEIKAIIEEEKKKVEANKTSIKTKQGELEALTKKALEANKAYQDALKLVEAKTAEISTLSEFNDNTLKAVGDFDKNQNEKQKLVDNYTKTENEILARIKTSGEKLKKLAIKQTANIDSAVSAANAKDLKTTKSFFDKFRPKN